MGYIKMPPEGEVVRLGFDKWKKEDVAACKSSIVTEAPELNGGLRAGIRVRSGKTQANGIRMVRFFASAKSPKGVDYAPIVHGGRPGVTTKGSPFLKWVTAVTGGRIDAVGPGVGVRFRKVGPAAPDPFIVRGLARRGLIVKGWKPNPGAKKGPWRHR